MHGKILSPSILAYDNCRIADGVGVVENSPAQWLHVDVMDGVFVPDITFGQGVVSGLRRCTDLFLDVHMMVTAPGNLVSSFADAGANLLTFHIEVPSPIEGVLDVVKKSGIKVGIAVNPGTPTERLIPYLSRIDVALVMGVEPGRCGQKFLPSTCEKIRHLAILRE
ncbi:MAG: ribulose-phosphate 3-epimerase, partial [Puniceicoccales bacterium]|nr:ribulose-phosphate 3-epimerase [Puniceicoccales bacterium]